jgi:hypothetical protein
MCVNLAAGTGIGCTEVAGSRDAFDRWQCWHALHQLSTSLASPGHRYLLAINRLVARTPVCARLCTAANTLCLNCLGTNGLITPLDTSTFTAEFSSCTVIARSTDDCSAAAQLLHSAWLAAISPLGGGE